MRITYADANSDGIISTSEIRREQNYYPFGLEHKGYNNAITGPKNNLKTYQGQEFTDDLQLNTHEWKFRVSDPAIGRFWQIDPLSEDFQYNSTYAFQENKLGMGVELEGRELDRFAEGFVNFFSNIGNILTESLNTKNQMEKRGAGGGERAELAKKESGQRVSQSAGKAAKAGEDALKGGVKLGGQVTSAFGDSVTIAGMVTLQPEIIAAGEVISETGEAIIAGVDISDGKPIENVALEFGVSAAISRSGNEAVKAGRRAAGKEFVESGSNKLSETILKGFEKTFDEIFGKAIENLKFEF